MRILSNKWWNVIRRQMTAIAATEHLSTQCPDCGTQMYLMKGKFGRFYKCKRLGCNGTLGAHLDGTPRVQKGHSELLDARRRARDAVHKVVAEVDYQIERVCEYGEVASVGKELRTIIKLAQLNPIMMPRRRAGTIRGYERAEGLYLRRRSVEECERVVVAASDYLRLIRRNAWDQILIEIIDRETKPPEDQDDQLSMGTMVLRSDLISSGWPWRTWRY